MGLRCVALTRALPPHLLVRGQPCGLGAPGGRPTPLLRAHLVGAGIPGSSQRGRRPSLRGPVGFSRLRRPSFWEGSPWCSGRNFHKPALGWGILLGWHPPNLKAQRKKSHGSGRPWGLRVKISPTRSSRPLTLKEREFSWSRRQTCPILQMRKLRFGKRKLSSQGGTAKKRHRSRIHTPSGSAVPPFFPLGRAFSATARPSKAPGSTHRLQWPRGRGRQPPLPPPLGRLCSHRFFPAGSGFLPSQECAPRMSILISPALWQN